MNSIFHQSLPDNLFDGVYYVDTENKISYWNSSATAITGFNENEVVGRRCSDSILMHVNDSGEVLCNKHCILHKTLKDGKIREAEIYLHHKDGHKVPVSVRVAPLRDINGKIVGGLEVFHDNTTKHNLIQELERLKQTALIDPLTGLGNRGLAEMNIKNRFAEFKRYGVNFAALFIDIDHFKLVNDTFGHSVGDKVLLMVSKTMSNCLRTLDLVCRWGGEEFVAIIPNVDEPLLKTISARLLKFVEGSSFSVGRRVLKVTVSIGGTIAKPEDTLTSLICRADSMMYKSKKKGRNQVTLDI